MKFPSCSDSDGPAEGSRRWFRAVSRCCEKPKRAARARCRTFEKGPFERRGGQRRRYPDGLSRSLCDSFAFAEGRKTRRHADVRPRRAHALHAHRDARGQCRKWRSSGRRRQKAGASFVGRRQRTIPECARAGTPPACGRAQSGREGEIIRRCRRLHLQRRVFSCPRRRAENGCAEMGRLRAYTLATRTASPQAADAKEPISVDENSQSRGGRDSPDADRRHAEPLKIHLARFFAPLDQTSKKTVSSGPCSLMSKM